MKKISKLLLIYTLNAFIFTALVSCGGNKGNVETENNVSIYYKGDVTSKEAKQFAIFIDTNFPGQNSEFMLSKINSSWVVESLVYEDKINDENYISICKESIRIFANHLNVKNSDVVIALSVGEHGNIKRVIRYDD